MEKREITPDTCSRTLSEKIYRSLRDSIIKNEIKPREIIYEKEVAARFNSSTTPVREAIKRLSTEGFLTVSPYRPAIVTEASFDKFLKISETMLILDSYASRKAAKIMTDRDLQILKGMYAELERSCSVATLEKYLEINAQIHIHIWKTLENEYLYSVIRQVFDSLLQGHRQIIYSQWTLNDSYLRKSLRYHKNLLDAFLAMDTIKVSRSVKNHWKIFFKK